MAINLTCTLARWSAFTGKWLLRLDWQGDSPTHQWVAVNIKLIATYDVKKHAGLAPRVVPPWARPSWIERFGIVKL